MKKLYKSAHMLIIISLIFFLCSCTTKSAIAKIPYGGNSSISYVINKTTINKETKDTPDIADKVISPEDTQKPANDENTEEEILLKELPEIDDNNTLFKESQIVGNDKLIEEELKRIILEFGEDDEEVPQVFFDEVKGYIRAFQRNREYRKFVNASLKRSARFLPLVKTVFNKRGIPEDMSYIAFIESGFNPRAVSHAGAVGMWQFVTSTARNYSLRVSRGLDERLDPIKSTYAAVDYFHDLIAIFGPKSFLLAMAAYNCGEGKIISCLKEIDDPFEERNFWHIRPCLSQETREYPPKIIASAIIGNNPEAFGFSNYEGGEDDILDPAIIADYRLDKGVPSIYTIASTRQEEKKIAKKSSRNKNIKKVIRPEPIFYVVQKGNNFPSIAEIFGVRTEDIKRWNHLRNNKLLAGQQIKIYPETVMEAVQYKVKKGDTVTEISESFKVRPKNIIFCNGLKNGWNLKAGQTLVFYKTIEKKPIIYVVKKGTHLTYISDKYNVRIKDIMMWNNLNSTTLYPGQKVKIYAKTTQDT